MTEKISCHVGLQQRVLPAYRVPFIEALGAACVNGLSVFAGQPQNSEMIVSAERLNHAQITRATNYHFSHPASTFYLCLQAGILEWLEKQQPDVLIIEANPRYLSNWRAVRWMHQKKRPVIGWGLGAPPITGVFSNLRYRERRTLIRQLDGVIAYSQRGAQEYQSMGINPRAIYVASNAVSPKPQKPPIERPDTFIGKPNVLFVGRLQERKKIDNLLFACAKLPEMLKPKLVIVGDGPARQTWENLAQEVYPGAEFVGAKHGAELESYFNQADLFVLPGTGGLAVQQAMAYGLPVIVAQGDGTQDDLVRPSTPYQPGNGWIIIPNDVDALTAALMAALSDVSGLRQKGRESYRIVMDEVNVENMVKVFLKAIKSVINKK